MDKLTREKRERMIFRFSFISTVFSLLLVLVFVAAQTYVRWTANQNFTFLGGNELEALTISAFVMLLGMLHIYRPEKSSTRSRESA